MFVFYEYWNKEYSQLVVHNFRGGDGKSGQNNWQLSIVNGKASRVQ